MAPPLKLPSHPIRLKPIEAVFVGYRQTGFACSINECSPRMFGSVILSTRQHGRTNHKRGNVCLAVHGCRPVVHETFGQVYDRCETSKVSPLDLYGFDFHQASIIRNAQAGEGRSRAPFGTLRLRSCGTRLIRLPACENSRNPALQAALC